jgi:hypothetical protein
MNYEYKKYDTGYIKDHLLGGKHVRQDEFMKRTGQREIVITRENSSESWTLLCGWQKEEAAE